MSAILPADRDRLINYQMPPEWAPHAATYIVWPHNLETWPGKFDPIPLVFARMAAAIAHFEPLRVLVNDTLNAQAIAALIVDAPGPFGGAARMARIEFVAAPAHAS